MTRLVLAASEGDPVVQLLDLDSGDVTPVPSPLDGAAAFDSGLARAGWVAVQVGCEVTAFAEGSLLTPVSLPLAWRMFPARSRDEVLLRLRAGPVAAVRRDGTVARSASFPAQDPVGETDQGVVMEGGVWSWDGRLVAPVAGGGKAFGVLSGRAIVVERAGQVDVTDGDGRVLGTCAIPPGNPGFGLDVQYDASASRLAATVWAQRGVLIAEVTNGPRWVPLEFAPYHPVWLSERKLLVFELAGQGASAVLDVVSGALTPQALPRRGPVPVVAVTGRFDPDEVRAVLVPKVWSPPSPADRDAALESHRLELEAAAPAPLRRYVPSATPAVRLRSCLPPRRLTLGGSRLGGRPDVPPGFRWPAHRGRPMAFLAQLRLDDVAPAGPEGGLPPRGLVLVFVGLEPDGGYPRSEAAVHVAPVDASALKRAPWPARLPEELRFGTAVLVPEPVLSLPSDPPGLPTRHRAAWTDFVERMAGPPPRHRMLGAIDVGGSRSGSLLLQIASDGIAGMVFGDGGSLLVLIEPHDLARGNFTSCTVDLETP